MDKENLIKAIDVVVNGLMMLKDSITNNGNTAEASTNSAAPAFELLAKRIAYAYSTRHPEYGVDSLFNDLSSMVNGNKFSYIISWMNRGNNEGMSGFFKLDAESQRNLLQRTLKEKEVEIKEIFKQRFGHDN